MSNTVDHFIDYLQFEKRLSNHTVVAYRKDLAQLQEFLNAKEMVLESTDKQVLREWVVNLAEQKLLAVSINRKIAAVRAYFRFLKKKGWIETDPSALLLTLKKPRRLPGFVEEPSMELLFDSAGFSETKSGKRDQLVIEILYGTGVRLAELIGLRISDFNVYDGTLKVVGKRAKDRIVPVTNTLAGLLTSYLSEREASTPSDPLLVTDKGAPLYPVFVQRLVKKYLSAVTSIAHKSPHLLRHTYATHLLNRGADLNAIKELLGHASLAATQIYTHNAIEELKRTFLQAHPKA